MPDDWLAERFEAERPRLLAMAHRLLGSSSEAEDAVQEGWLRLSRAEVESVENLSGWLTTVVARVCLDLLRSRRSRREQPLAGHGEGMPAGADPERDAVLAESVGFAMLAVLDRLSPAERVAFVLHDVFGLAFEEIAPIVDRSPVATRKLASRARGRVQGVTVDGQRRDEARHGQVVAAFLAAARHGNFEALLALLDPGVVLRPDAAALQLGMRNGWITGEKRGAEAVARQFSGQAQGAVLARIDGQPAAAWAPGGRPVVAFIFTIEGGRIATIDLVADPERLAAVAVETDG